MKLTVGLYTLIVYEPRHTKQGLYPVRHTPEGPVIYFSALFQSIRISLRGCRPCVIIKGHL